MKKLINRLNKIEEFVLVVLFALMVGIIFVQVVMRYVFHNSLYWSEELGKFLFIWISWLGISIGERRGEHIKITMLVDKLSVKGQHIANIISEIIVIVICAVTVFYGVTLVFSQAGTNYAGIKISVAWGYLAVVVGCGMMILRSIGMCLLSVRGMKDETPLHEMIEEKNRKYEEGGHE